MGSDHTCFKSALGELERLVEEVSSYDYKKEVCVTLSHKLRFLRTFHMFARKWSNDVDDDASLRALLVRIEDAVSKIAQDAHLCLNVWEWDLVPDARHCIHYSFEEEINQWYIKFSDCGSSHSSHDSNELVEFIDSIMGRPDFLYNQQKRNIALVQLLEALEEKLMFLKNFIRFTILRGGGTDDDRNLERNLLSHIKAMAVSAAYHFHRCQFRLIDEKIYEITYMEEKISELLQRIMPGDPHVYKTYVQALDASKSSRQLQDHHILEEFVDSLLSNLWEILTAGTSPVFSNMDQLEILYEGLKSLKTILKEQPKDFDETMRDLIGVVVCDAGLVIISLFLDAIEDGFAQEMDLLLFHLLERIKFIRAKVEEEHPEASVFNFSTVDELGFIDILLEKLRELMDCKANSTAIAKHPVQTIYQELECLQPFLGKIWELRDTKEERHALWNRAMELAYRVEFLIDSLVTGDVSDSSLMSFHSVAEEFKILKLDALKFSNKKGVDALKFSENEGLDVKMKKVTKRSNDFLPLESSSSIIKDEIIRLEDEARSIMNRLIRGADQLQIIAIVGMPGLGKTTFAKLIYNDFSISHYIHIRAWCCISQVHNKKNLFLEMLTCILGNLSNEYFKKSEEDLALELYKQLRKKKYLIVLDDVWHIDAWKSLENTFPDNKNGSRIILTTRDVDVAPKEQLHGKPHFLRELTDEESWKLLKAKLFQSNYWSPTLCELGKQMVKMCKGLPLTIVVLAGILAKIKQDGWEEIVKGLSSSSVSILENCKNTLELSYRYLPDKLKPCLLYFGAFPEDREHTAEELIRLWIAEGFVCKTQSMIIEDNAKDYLMHLISKSLVMVDKRSWAGEVKTCRIHDLLHAFCVEKAEKQSFFQSLQRSNELSDSNLEPHNNVRRLCIHYEPEHFKMTRLFCPQLRSLFFFCSEWHRRLSSNPLLYIGKSKLVRVLDLSRTPLGDDFLDEIGLLVQLRYLAVEGWFSFVPSSIDKLSNLETLIVVNSLFPRYTIELPNNIWNLKKLRHLQSKVGSFTFSNDNLDNSAELFDLQTFYNVIVSWKNHEKLLKNIPNIRKLKLKVMFPKGGNYKVRVLNNLSCLESLRVWRNKRSIENQVDICFPLNLRKLTLGGFFLPWCKISAIANLPKLEVLKLCFDSFVGWIWNMEEAEQFRELRYLKLEYLSIFRWTASRSGQDHFPRLEKLVLNECPDLQEVPSCLGDIPNLQMIKASYCSNSVVSSIKQIAEELVDMGNEDLKVLIS